MTRHKLHSVIIVLFFTAGWNVYGLQGSFASAYGPTVGDQTWYDYGFINVLYNQTAVDINYWTNLSLADSNYTMRWQQYANLSIRVSHLVPSGSIIQAYYNFSVNIFSNVVTILNSTWQNTITLNGSVPAPAPTGVLGGLVNNPTIQGLPGFFLDDGTLNAITSGTSIIIGESLWQTVSYTTYTINANEQLCYHLINSSTTINQQVDTSYIIDQDVGIFYHANETTVFTVDSIETYLTYYYQVLTTNISLVPPPSPVLIYIGIAIAVIIVIIVVILLLRVLWLRRRY